MITAARHLFAFALCLSGIAALYGLAVGSVPIYGWSVVAAAIAGVLWGLVASLDDDQRRRAARPVGTAHIHIHPDVRGISSEVVHRPARAFTVIEGGKSPMWPHDSGAPE